MSPSSRLEIEVLGRQPGPLEEIERLLALALASAGIEDGPRRGRVRQRRADRRAQRRASRHARPDRRAVVSDRRRGPSPGPRELGDIVICPEHTADLREAIVHGALHLTGMDHETDDGEMLAVQREIMAWVTPS